MIRRSPFEQTLIRDSDICPFAEGYNDYNRRFDNEVLPQMSCIGGLFLSLETIPYIFLSSRSKQLDDKTMPQETLEAVINDLRNLGVDVDRILKLNPTEEMLRDLRDGLVRLRSLPDVMVAARSMINSL